MFDLTANNFFENKDLNQYKVSIQISLDGFSFLIARETENEIIAGKNSPVKISSPALTGHHFADWHSSEPLLKLPFQKVAVYIFEELFTLVPAETDENTVEQINRILLGPENERKHYSNKTLNDMSVNFAIHSELATQVEKAFSEVEWIHPVAVLLDHLPETDKPNLSLLIRTQNHYFLIIRQRTKLLLANCFAANHSNDLIYQVINTFQQLKVSRNLTQLMISGTSENHLKTAETLAPYFQNISFFPPEKEGFKGINPMHHYLTTL
jgi:hypothetical protein